MNTFTAKLLIAILVTFMSITIVNVILHMFKDNYKTETATAFSTSNTVNFKGVYIRDEQIVEYDGKGVISYAVPDGGKLAKGSVVANVYESEEQIETKKKIESLKSELGILEKIQNPGTADVAIPSYLSNLISEKYKSIVYVKEKKDYVQLKKEKEELLIYLSTMQIITKESKDFSDRIASIEAEIAQLEMIKEEPINEIKVSEASYFVSYADGYEDIFKKSLIDELKVEDIRNVQDDFSKIGEKSKIIGKIIKDYEWYIAGIINNSDKLFKQNDTVKLNIETAEKPVTASIYEVKETQNESESLIILKCSNLTYDLVQHRVENIQIIPKDTYEGIKIPRKAIQFKNFSEIEEDTEGNEVEVTKEVKGVYVKLGENILFKKLDIIFEGDDFVISKPNITGSYVELYDDVIVEGVGYNEN
jgi:hypothetical protein